MKKINLRELYPDAYTTDFFVNVTEDVLETIRASERAEAAYERKMYRYKAQYSLDCENGIENTVLTKPQTPEMVLEEKQLQKQVYFRHSCTFCTPHFFYINSNKPTADRTKAIHRRLELSCNLYLLLLFVGQNRASKSHLHITLRISRFLQSFQQIKLLKDYSIRKNHLAIVVFLGWPYAVVK